MTCTNITACLLVTFFAIITGHSAQAIDRGTANVVAISNAEKAVKALLKDPDSAQFKDVAAYRPASNSVVPQIVCGYVNSRNGFGGYTGFQRFVWLPLDAALKADFDTGSALMEGPANGLVSMCRDKGREPNR